MVHHTWLYVTSLGLNRMGLTNNNVCWKCQKDKGTFIHCIWDCPLIQPFMAPNKYFGTTIPLSPRLCLLGDREQMPNITKGEFVVICDG